MCYDIRVRGWILQHLSSPAGRIDANNGALRNQCDGGARVLARTLLVAIYTLSVSKAQGALFAPCLDLFSHLPGKLGCLFLFCHLPGKLGCFFLLTSIREVT